MTEQPDRSPSRWPASVYGVGKEPDPRVSLANERTFLAWIRTGLGFLAGAAALDVVASALERPSARWIAAVLALGALICGVQSWRGWTRTERAVRLGRPLPATSLALPLALVVSVLAVLIVAMTVVS